MPPVRPAFFGIGAANLSAEIDAQGSDAANAGCGGAGSGCAEGSGKCRGGNGADGCVIIYGYRRGLFADEGGDEINAAKSVNGADEYNDG